MKIVLLTHQSFVCCLMFAQCEGFLFPCPVPTGWLGISKNLGGETADLNFPKRYSVRCNFIFHNETVVAAAEGGEGFGLPRWPLLILAGHQSACALKVFFLLKTLNSVTV